VEKQKSISGTKAQLHEIRAYRYVSAAEFSFGSEVGINPKQSSMTAIGRLQYVVSLKITLGEWQLTDSKPAPRLKIWRINTHGQKRKFDRLPNIGAIAF